MNMDVLENRLIPVKMVSILKWPTFVCVFLNKTENFGIRCKLRGLKLSDSSFDYNLILPPAGDMF